MTLSAFATHLGANHFCRLSSDRTHLAGQAPIRTPFWCQGSLCALGDPASAPDLAANAGKLDAAWLVQHKHRRAGSSAPSSGSPRNSRTKSQRQFFVRPV